MGCGVCGVVFMGCIGCIAWVEVRTAWSGWVDGVEFWCSGNGCYFSNPMDTLRVCVFVVFRLDENVGDEDKNGTSCKNL